MRELVILRDRHCVFPHCATEARSCDLDHIKPYRQPPDPAEPDRASPGQTTPDNLAPLCRRHHNIKTHGRWRYRRNPDGAYTWTSPRALTYLVTRQGTIRLD
jgi:5-methylcytosine-specific restriction endonuclease McrA